MKNLSLSWRITLSPDIIHKCQYVNCYFGYNILIQLFINVFVYCLTPISVASLYSVDWKGCGRKQSCPSLGRWPGICRIIPMKIGRTGGLCPESCIRNLLTQGTSPHKQLQCLVLTTNGYKEENFKKWKSKNILKCSPRRKRGLYMPT